MLLEVVYVRFRGWPFSPCLRGPPQPVLHLLGWLMEPLGRPLEIAARYIAVGLPVIDEALEGARGPGPQHYSPWNLG